MRPTFDDQMPAIALLLSLHKYSRWVRSLRCSRPLSRATASKELQRMVDLQRHLSGAAEKVKAIVDIHLDLIRCSGNGIKGPLQTELSDLVARQVRAVAQLSAYCEALTWPAAA